MGNGDARCIADSLDPRRIDEREAGRTRGGIATPRPRLAEALRERVEAEADRMIAVYVEALDHPDARVRIQAAEALLARVYGKPGTRIDVEAVVGPTIEELMLEEPLALGTDAE